MVHYKIRLPRPISFFKGLGWELSEDRRFSVCWGMELRQRFPSSFSLPLMLLLGPGSSYSLPPCSCSQIHIIRGNELDKVEGERSANPSFEDGRVGVIVKVAGDNLAFSVAWDAYEALWCLLHHFLGVTIFGSFLQMAGQIHDPHTGNRDMEAMPGSFQLAEGWFWQHQ